MGSNEVQAQGNGTTNGLELPVSSGLVPVPQPASGRPSGAADMLSELRDFKGDKREHGGGRDAMGMYSIHGEQVGKGALPTAGTQVGGCAWSCMNPYSTCVAGKCMYCWHG